MEVLAPYLARSYYKPMHIAVRDGLCSVFIGRAACGLILYFILFFLTCIVINLKQCFGVSTVSFV